jgi:ankyrin repeat protein
VTRHEPNYGALTGATPVALDGRAAVDLADAIVHGRWDEAERLLANGVVDINASVSEEGATLLHRAVEARNPSFVRRLLEAGADPDRPDRAGATPLLVACRGDLPVEAKLLLDYGAKPNGSNHGWTALRYAAKDRNGQIIRILLAGGARMSIQDDAVDAWAAELDAFVREIATVEREVKGDA